MNHSNNQSNKLRKKKRAEREERERKEAVEKEKKRVAEGKQIGDLKFTLEQQVNRKYFSSF